MLQQQVIQRIEQIYRLRLLYGVNLALYGILLVVSALSSPDHWQSAALMVMTWLPVILLHTTLQSLIELRERRTAYVPIPVPAFNYRAIPVQLYDENGNLLRSENKFSLLPRSGSVDIFS